MRVAAITPFGVDTRVERIAFDIDIMSPARLLKIKMLLKKGDL
jgi:hypothetical protein